MDEVGTANLTEIELFIEGETDELPVTFAPLLTRRLFWKEYGVVLPGFGPDEAMDALMLNGIEARRAERDRKRAEMRALQEQIRHGR